MRRLRAWLVRLVATFAGLSREQDVLEEIESNLDFHIEENIDRGMTPVEARRQALIRLGGIESTRERWREQERIPVLESLVKDISYGFRMLGRNKGWTAVAILSLGVGIGANTAVFSAVNRTWLERLPVRKPSELVTLRFPTYPISGGSWSTTTYGFSSATPQGERTISSLPYPVFERLRESATTLTEVFAFAQAPPISLSGTDASETPRGQLVSGGYYRGLGVGPRLGRLITETDDTLASDPVVVISEEYWTRAFGADPNTVGQQLAINDVPFTIVGVAPRGLGNLASPRSETPDLSMPLSMESRLGPFGASRLTSTTNFWLVVMGRLSPGASREQAEAELQAVFADAMPEPADASASAVLMVTLAGNGVYDPEPEHVRTLTILSGVFGIILGLVCVNVGNLLLFRGESRQHEITVRLAIGASRARLIQQLLTESVILALCGGLAGLLIAWVCLEVLPLAGATLDIPALLFAMGASVFVGIAFGLAPATRTTRTRLLVHEGIHQSPPSRSAVTRALVGGQVALTVTLLVTAGLLVRTIVNLGQVDPGFNTHELLVVRESPGFFFSSFAPPQDARFDQFAERIRNLPGVRSVARASQAFLNNQTNTSGIRFEGQDPDADRMPVVRVTVDPGFLETMEIPLLAGRSVATSDYERGPQVAFVNDAFVQRFFPDRSPIGRRIGFSTETPPDIEIVGIVGNVRYRNLRDPAPPMLFLSEGRNFTAAKTMLVRTAGDPTTVIPAIRLALQEVDPSVTNPSITTQEEIIRAGYTTERGYARAATAFGGLALFLSAIGLFGLMSYTMVRRTKEIGIRMALGAEAGRVVRDVVGQSALLIGAGAFPGLVLSLFATRLVDGLLFGLSPADPLTLAGVVLLMFLVGAGAAYLPARRASRIDPLIALRHD